MPRNSYVLTISSTNVSSGHVVRVYNQTNGETLSGIFNASGNAVLDLANLITEVVNGDIIQVKVNGKFEAFATSTVTTAKITAGGDDVELTGVATSSTLSDIS